MYIIPQGTKGKLIELVPGVDAMVTDWMTRKQLVFTECLAAPVVAAEKIRTAKRSLAERLTSEGYALFGGDTGGDRQAKYVLAVPYAEVKHGLQPIRPA